MAPNLYDFLQQLQHLGESIGVCLCYACADLLTTHTRGLDARILGSCSEGRSSTRECANGQQQQPLPGNFAHGHRENDAIGGGLQKKMSTQLVDDQGSAGFAAAED